MNYLAKKGFSSRNPEKSSKEKLLTQDQVQLILEAVIRENGPDMHRDHAMIYLGFHFALRVGEVVKLTRETFRDIDKDEAHIKTLKSSDRIQFTCHHCHRRRRLALNRSGQKYTCGGCGKESPVPESKNKNAQSLPEKSPPAIEVEVIEYVKDYIKNHMKEDQNYLFETNAGPISKSYVSRIFGHYVNKAGLSLIYSWHALRHGRGVFLWERFTDLVMVRDMLRQKSLSSAEVYVHMSPKRTEEIRNKLSQGGIRGGF